MTDASRLEAIAAAVAGLAVGELRAVLPTRTPAGVEHFVCAFARDDDRFAWVVVDGDGAPLHAADAVRAAVEVAAMTEAAEEASSLLAVGEALPALDRLGAVADAAGAEAAALAATEMRAALEPFAELTADEVRVADAGRIDRIAAAVQLVGDRFDLLAEAAGSLSARLTGEAGDPLEPVAEAAWTAVRVLSRDGRPDRFREQFEGSIGAAMALSEDVLQHYLVPLEGGSE